MQLVSDLFFIKFVFYLTLFLIILIEGNRRCRAYHQPFHFKLCSSESVIQMIQLKSTLALSSIVEISRWHILKMHHKYLMSDTNFTKRMGIGI